MEQARVGNLPFCVVDQAGGCVNESLYSLFSAVLCKLGVPLGPMPNEDIDVSNLEALEKYRSFTRYWEVAEKENKKPHWWRTYKKVSSPKQGT